MPTNGAIYSDVSVIVRRDRQGPCHVATPNRIIIGGNLLYQGDTAFLNPSYGQNVLGLEAMNEVVVPCWITGDLDWRAALLSETKTVGRLGHRLSTSGASCSNTPTSGNRMRHRGSATLTTEARSPAGSTTATTSTTTRSSTSRHRGSRRSTRTTRSSRSASFAG